MCWRCGLLIVARAPATAGRRPPPSGRRSPLSFTRGTKEGAVLEIETSHRSTGATNEFAAVDVFVHRLVMVIERIVEALSAFASSPDGQRVLESLAQMPEVVRRVDALAKAAGTRGAEAGCRLAPASDTDRMKAAAQVAGCLGIGENEVAAEVVIEALAATEQPQRVKLGTRWVDRNDDVLGIETYRFKTPYAGSVDRTIAPCRLPFEEYLSWVRQRSSALRLQRRAEAGEFLPNNRGRRFARSLRREAATDAIERLPAEVRPADLPLTTIQLAHALNELASVASATQMKIVRMLVEGWGRRDAAAALGISRATVDVHMHRLVWKRMKPGARELVDML